MSGALDTALKAAAKQVIADLGSALNSTITYTRKVAGTYNTATGALATTDTTYADIDVPIEFIKSEEDEGREMRQAKLSITPDLIGDNQPTKNPWKAIEQTKGAPYIAPRFKVPTKYKLNQSIFIGNRAEYTERALLSPKSNIGAYILNGSGTFKEGIRQKIDRIFTDKSPNINVLGLDA
jgi:hypothetical protein